MGKHHGFQQRGFVNPLAAARAAGGASGPVARHEGVATITIKEYLARPRPTLDEFKEKLAEKEREQRELDEWEERSGAEYRKLLARDRKRKLAAAASATKRARKHSSSGDEDDEEDDDQESDSSSSSSTTSSSDDDDGEKRKHHRKHKKHRHKHHKRHKPHHKRARTAQAGDEDDTKGPWKLSEFFRAARAKDTTSHHHHKHHHHHHHKQ